MSDSLDRARVYKSCSFTRHQGATLLEAASPARFEQASTGCDSSSALFDRPQLKKEFSPPPVAFSHFDSQEWTLDVTAFVYLTSVHLSLLAVGWQPVGGGKGLASEASPASGRLQTSTETRDKGDGEPTAGSSGRRTDRLEEDARCAHNVQHEAELGSCKCLTVGFGRVTIHLTPSIQLAVQRGRGGLSRVASGP